MKTPVRHRARVRGRQTVVGISFNAALTDWARDLSRPNNPDDHFNQNYTNQLKQDALTNYDHPAQLIRICKLTVIQTVQQAATS